MSARMGLMDGDYPSPDARKLFYDRLLEQLRADPEFDAVALTNRFRMVFSGNAPIEIDGKTYTEQRDRPNANFEQVTGGVLRRHRPEAARGPDVHRRRSRLAAAGGHRQRGVRARSTSARESALGRRFRTTSAGRHAGRARGATIVGVVSDRAHARAVQQPERGRQRLLRAVLRDAVRAGRHAGAVRQPVRDGRRQAARRRERRCARQRAAPRGDEGGSESAALLRRHAEEPARRRSSPRTASSRRCSRSSASSRSCSRRSASTA